ncbi:hypothetical protein [Cloacibacillus evryensis]|uniref:hypothetical protein n=1 Tax=Cloacibacillus evryensis TaxID=508460 RepID=UPI003AB57AFE
MAVAALGGYIKSLLESEEFMTVFPTADSRFRMLSPYASGKCRTGAPCGSRMMKARQVRGNGGCRRRKEWYG